MSTFLLFKVMRIRWTTATSIDFPTIDKRCNWSVSSVSKRETCQVCFSVFAFLQKQKTKKTKQTKQCWPSNRKTNQQINLLRLTSHYLAKTNWRVKAGRRLSDRRPGPRWPGCRHWRRPEPDAPEPGSRFATQNNADNATKTNARPGRERTHRTQEGPGSHTEPEPRRWAGRTPWLLRLPRVLGWEGGTLLGLRSAATVWRRRFPDGLELRPSAPSQLPVRFPSHFGAGPNTPSTDWPKVGILAEAPLRHEH